ncbi:MAG: hypothetical protein PUC47_09000 [Oscillospiraceae bacterium]|nr:hypothetical protein [Oscillospiraceae bacterium]
MTRESILQTLRQALEPLPYVHALWLEGADAQQMVDEYSDFDINVDVEDDHADEIFRLVESLFPMDQVWDTGRSDEFLYRVYHIRGTSDYWMLDFNLHLHSTGRSGSTFYEGDWIDKPLVLFDKSGVVIMNPPRPPQAPDPERVQDIRFHFSQAGRVRKYIFRGQFPEAYIYYNKYIIEPLVSLIRMKYTPDKRFYYMVHISRHIPSDALARLTALLQNPDLEALSAHLEDALLWYEELTAELGV